MPIHIPPAAPPTPREFSPPTPEAVPTTVPRRPPTARLRPRSDGQPQKRIVPRAVALPVTGQAAHQPVGPAARQPRVRASASARLRTSQFACRMRTPRHKITSRARVCSCGRSIPMTVKSQPLTSVSASQGRTDSSASRAAAPSPSAFQSASAPALQTDSMSCLGIPASPPAVRAYKRSPRPSPSVH